MNPHLDLVDHDQDAALVQNARQLLEIAFRWDDVSTCSLNRLDVKRREFRLLRFAVPHGVILSIEELLELLDTVEAAVLDLLVVRTAKAIGERDELGAVGEVAEAAAVAIAGCDG